jgi:hypothetical protein
MTLTGTIPPDGKPVVILEGPPPEIATGHAVKFTFSAPLPHPAAPVLYELSFCIGPVANPCGLRTSFVVKVPGGEERTSVVDTGIFKKTDVLVVGQGTAVPLPYAVTFE